MLSWFLLSLPLLEGRAGLRTPPGPAPRAAALMGSGEGLWERWLGPAPSCRHQPAAWYELHVDLAPSRGISPALARVALPTQNNHPKLDLAEPAGTGQRDEEHLLCFPSPVAHVSFSTTHPDRSRRAIPIPKVPRKAQISVCTCAGSQGSGQLPPRAALLAQPQPHTPALAPGPFRTQLSVILEHEAQPGHSDFCNRTRALPPPRSRDTVPAQRSGVLTGSPPPALPRLPDPFQRAPPNLSRWAGEGKGPAKQGATPTAFSH